MNSTSKQFLPFAKADKVILFVPVLKVLKFEQICVHKKVNNYIPPDFLQNQPYRKKNLNLDDACLLPGKHNKDRDYTINIR